MKRVSDVAPADKVSPAWLKPAEVEGIDLALVEFFNKDGQYGEYVVIRATKPDTGEVVHVATGSETVMEQLVAIGKAKAFPCLARFTRSGRRWLLE